MVTIILIIGMVAALAVGVYVGLGMPGMPGREDRVVKGGRPRHLAKQEFLDWLRPKKRRRPHDR